MLLNKLVGTMPEDLPTPKKSLKQLEKENNRQLLKEQKNKIYHNTSQNFSANFLQLLPVNE